MSDERLNELAEWATHLSGIAAAGVEELIAEIRRLRTSQMPPHLLDPDPAHTEHQ